jgi:hypothetical protein
MSRMNPLHWIGGLALEIGAVAGAVMLLPKADLRPDRAVPDINQLDMNRMPLPALAEQQPAWWQAAPQAAATSWQPPPQPPQPQRQAPAGGSFAVDAPAILTIDPWAPPAVEQTAWQPSAQESPAFSPDEPDQLSPAAVEQTLDRASQQLLNSVSGYLFHQADQVLQESAVPQRNLPPASAAPQQWRKY